MLDGRQLDERKLAVLDGRESSGVGYGVVAGWIISAGWADWETAALLDGRQADERKLAMLDDGRESAG